jgi:5-formyltetrahydrofolate cyclo-ligase
MGDTEHGGDTPCFAQHLIEGQPVDPDTWRDVNRYRKAERARLMALRRAVSQSDLALMAQTVAEHLRRRVTPGPGLVIAGYWPIRGELDLRFWLAEAHDAGAEIALPVVEQRDAPVAFHRWTPGCKMTRGVWDIPIPAEALPLEPQLVICPLLGVDRAGYRLGNGGGYYDRTLAALFPRPEVIGVGHGFCAIETIFPMPWDIPMDVVMLGEDGRAQQQSS